MKNFELELELRKQIAAREVFINKINSLSPKSIYRGVDLVKTYRDIIKEEEKNIIPLLEELATKKY